MTRRKCINTVLPCLFGERLSVSILCPGHQLPEPHWTTAPCPPRHAAWEPLALMGLEGREQRSYWRWRSCRVKNQGQSCGNVNNAGPEQNCGAGPWSWGPRMMLKVRDQLGRAGEEDRQESPCPPWHTMGATQPSCRSWSRGLCCGPP